MLSIHASLPWQKAFLRLASPAATSLHPQWRSLVVRQRRCRPSNGHVSPPRLDQHLKIREPHPQYELQRCLSRQRNPLRVAQLLFAHIVVVAEDLAGDLEAAGAIQEFSPPQLAIPLDRPRHVLGSKPVHGHERPDDNVRAGHLSSDSPDASELARHPFRDRGRRRPPPVHCVI